MGGPDEARSERDRSLRANLISAAELRMIAYREWLQEELIAIRPQLETLEAAQTGPLKLRLQSKIERVDDWNARELGEAVRAFKDRCAECRDDDDSVLGVELYLQEAIWRFEQILRELALIRGFVDDFADSAD